MQPACIAYEYIICIVVCIFTVQYIHVHLHLHTPCNVPGKVTAAWKHVLKLSIH